MNPATLRALFRLCQRAEEMEARLTPPAKRAKRATRGERRAYEHVKKAKLHLLAAHRAAGERK